MKTLILNLKKKIYILESDIQNPNHLAGYIDSELNEHKVKFICKGDQLTEEICETLISKKDVAKNQSKMCGLKFKEGFINMVKENGYYWGENPIVKPESYDKWMEKNEYPGFWQFEKCKNYEEVESKIFKLEKTLIFEILKT